ncbi:hypothetical protein F1640_14995 [Novosphingobium sp. NBM11]|uniref:hypothetical protein n=1 Tax=Novosphingobium sp. NBM11 TaxID=2596914 RepID=UPI001892565A|nr:hypothetical protein [Novosphingobium sp. NBM11]MBF5091293.1 hypothetical protein [Novosphingobium sp. NBM11]
MLKLADLLREAFMGMKTRAEREEVLLKIGATADEAKAACDALEEMEAQTVTEVLLDLGPDFMQPAKPHR